MTKTEPERLAIVETEILAVKEKVNSIENSLQSLHGKFDIFNKTLAENYVPITTFNEYKLRIIEEGKNQLLKQIGVGIIMLIIGGLVGFFFKNRM